MPALTKQLLVFQTLVAWQKIKKFQKTKYLFGQNQSVSHEINPRGGVSDVVERVRGLQAVVGRVVHDSGGQRVEADQVRQGFVGRVFDDVTVDDVGSRQEPVGELFLRVDWDEVVALQELEKRIDDFYLKCKKK